MTQTSIPEPSQDTVTPSLDPLVRQHIVSLALAGAHHGMEAEARVILRALPLLVPQREARQCLHAALLIALGDVLAAEACLADLEARGQADAPTADVLRHWLDATRAVQSHRQVGAIVTCAPAELPSAPLLSGSVTSATSPTSLTSLTSSTTSALSGTSAMSVSSSTASSSASSP